MVINVQSTPSKRIGTCLAAFVAMAGLAASVARAESNAALAWGENGGRESTLLPPASEEALGELPSDDLVLAPSDFTAPRWRVRAGAVLLQRARPDSAVIVIDAASGDPLLDANQLVFPFRGGVDVGLLRHGTVADVEFRYFGVEQWTASVGPNLYPPGAQLNFPDEEPSTETVAAALRGSSSLHSVELNLRRNVAPRWTWLAGLRYVSFRDSMGLLFGDPTFTEYGTLSLGTTNNQIGRAHV